MKFYKRLLSSISVEQEIFRKKIRYLATRRGIVENEILFGEFINTHFDKLQQAEVNLFNDLLQEYDWDIFAWITEQRKVPEKYADSSLIKWLKDCKMKK